MSKKTKTTSTQTTTPNNPDWVTSSLTGLNSRITGLGNVDPQSYVPGASGLQQQAFTGAGNLGGWAQYMHGAQGLVDGSNDLNLDQFQNPYQHQVTDAAMADFDHNAGQTRAMQQAAAGNTQAFGGSRYGVAQAETEGELARARNTGLAGILEHGFDTSLGAAQNEQNRKLSAAGIMGALGNDSANNARSDVATQEQAGGIQRGIAQDQATAPISLAQALSSLYGSNQMGLFQGSTTNGTSTTKSSDPMAILSSVMGGLGSGAQGAGSLASLFGGGSLGASTSAGLSSLAAFASDRRLKKDIKTLGHHKGHRWVQWRWKWEGADAKPSTGVIAQEVRNRNPSAVIRHALGFLMVDYSQLERPAWLS